MSTSAVSEDVDRLIREYLETKFGRPLDYFVIEGRMSPNTNGDTGVTGNYRKAATDKNVFYTVT